MPALSRIMLVTDRTRTGGRDLVEQVAGVVSGGISLVQVREKDLPDIELVELIGQIQDRTAGKIQLLVNGRPEVARRTGLPSTAVLHAGTTDSIAAFLASGARRPGEAVTSLGSTLVLKLCTTKPVFSNRNGIYSHRLDDSRWLAGGASNSGGAVLQAEFSDEELAELSARMHPDEDTGLDYYPLPSRGERFPVADPDYPPKMDPKPMDRVRYLQGLFEGIARIEKQGYDLLEALGTDPVASIRSAGGGAKNAVFTRIRQRIVDRPLLEAENTDAAYGSALLAAGRV